MRKIVFSVVFSMILVLMLSASALALTEGDWEFQLLDNEVTITGYIGDDEDVVVPSTLFGATVTKVKLPWGWDNNFSNVKSLEYPGTVKVISNNGVDETLEEITLNEGTEVIYNEAFDECSNIQSVHLPSTIKEIGKWAFDHCTSLSKINFHSGIQYIGYGAFHNTAITELDLSVLSDSCVIESGSGGFRSLAAFGGCTELKSVKFRATEKAIPESMFYGCSALENVEIPNTVTEIGSDAFSHCTSLTQIILPTSLKTIGWGAFEKTGLKEVVIPYGATEISSDAFSKTDSLQSLYIPDTVKKMGYIIDDSNNCIIYCTAGSYTAEYCKKNSVSYLTDNSVNSAITVYYNGTRVSFHTYDQNPELINDRTLVPLRAIFEAMGADVEWDNDTQTVTSTRYGVRIKLTIGDNALYKNGETIPVDVPAQLVNDRTMIPVRVIAEAFGAEVQWNNNGRAVLITE